MVPRTIYSVEAMPLNANGKIDRKEFIRRLVTGALDEASAWRAA
jgi:hypothetical protein